MSVQRFELFDQFLKAEIGDIQHVVALADLLEQRAALFMIRHAEDRLVQRQ